MTTDGYEIVGPLRMHYERRGGGPTLVLLHGGGGAAEMTWKEAIPYFSNAFDVIAPDQMGQGRTNDEPNRPFSYHEMAEDTVALLTKLGVHRATLVGWSDGGNIALDIAMNHPELVHALVVSGANFSVDGLDPNVHIEAERWDSARAFYGRVSPDGPSHWPTVIERMRAMWRSQPAWNIRDLGKIKASTLVIVGDHDLVRPAHAADMFRAIPGAQLTVLPGASHFVVIDDAARWNAVVMHFLVSQGSAHESP